MSTQETVKVIVLVNDDAVRYFKQVGEVPLVAVEKDLLSVTIKDPGEYLMGAMLRFPESEYEIAPLEKDTRTRKIWMPIINQFFQLALHSRLDKELVKVHFRCVSAKDPCYPSFKEGDVGLSFDVRLNQNSMDRVLGPFGGESF